MDGRTGAVMKHRYVLPSQLRVTFKARGGKKEREKLSGFLLSPKTVYNKERKFKVEKKHVPRSQNHISFNIVAHSGLMKEAFSGQVPSLVSLLLQFLYTFTVFLSVLGSNQQP